MHSDQIINLKRVSDVGAADSVNLGAIFGLFLSDETTTLLENTLKFVLFPIAALGSCLQALLAWKQYKIDKERSSLGRFGIEAVSALAITTAVVGALAAHSLFILAAPVIFTVVTGLKSLFHLGAACYNTVKYAITGESQYKSSAVTHAVGFVAMGLTAAAVGMVMIAAKPIYALLGLAAAAIGCAFSVYKRFTIQKPFSKEQQQPLLNDRNSAINSSAPSNEPTNSAVLHASSKLSSNQYTPPPLLNGPGKSSSSPIPVKGGTYSTTRIKLGCTPRPTSTAAKKASSQKDEYSPPTPAAVNGHSEPDLLKTGEIGIFISAPPVAVPVNGAGSINGPTASSPPVMSPAGIL